MKPPIAKVVPHDELDEHVDWVLDQVSRMAPKATAMVKDDINRRLPPPAPILDKKSGLG